MEDIDDLVEEVVDDLFVRRFHHADVPEFARAAGARDRPPGREEPDRAARAAAAPADTLEAMRVRLAEAVRAELDVRKRRTGVMTYDDLLTRLDAALSGDGGAAAAARLRERYRVVLVDEFQDTDPVQWDILRRAFGDGGVTLVLIGDPKQAIYAFRGADVFAYLDAAARRRPARDARDQLAQRPGAHRRLRRALRAAPGSAIPASSTARCARPTRTARRGCPARPADAALRVRVVHRDSPSIELTHSGLAETDSTRRHVAADLAGDVVRLLDSAAAIETRAEDGTVLRPRARPARPRRRARPQPPQRRADPRRARRSSTFPAVISGAGSVFGSPSAQDWLRLLEAVERPTHAPRARSAALTPFLGWSAERVACAGRGGVGGAAPPAARLGAPAARSTAWPRSRRR